MIVTTISGMSYQLGDIYSICRYAGMLLHINGKFTMGKLKSFLCRNVSFLPVPHCQFRGVGQGVKVNLSFNNNYINKEM